MLTQEQKDIIIQTMKPYHPTKIGIFGSIVRNEETENSDIDILYQLKNTVGLFKLVGLKQDLEKKLNEKVDLVDFKAIHPKLKKHILSDCKMIYEE